jgi:hypothetical protein
MASSLFTLCISATHTSFGSTFFDPILLGTCREVSEAFGEPPNTTTIFFFAADHFLFTEASAFAKKPALMRLYGGGHR